MARYKMKHKFLFVDAKDLSSNKRKPDEIPFAHVLNQTNSPANKCLKLNDTAGFITRFIVLGVDTNLIPQILRSEFGGDEANHQTEVGKVETLLKDYGCLQNLPVFTPKPYDPPESLGEDNISSGYDLDFRVNWFATGWIKG